jgi:hypothetical protein
MELRECLVWRGPYRVQKKATGPDETRTEIRDSSSRNSPDPRRHKGIRRTLRDNGAALVCKLERRGRWQHLDWSGTDRRVTL